MIFYKNWVEKLFNNHLENLESVADCGFASCKDLLPVLTNATVRIVAKLEFYFSKHDYNNINSFIKLVLLKK